MVGDLKQQKDRAGLWVLPLQSDNYKGIAMSRLYRSAVFFLTLFLSIGVWAENPDHVQQAKDTGSCPSCDLSAADLSGLNASMGDFSTAALQGASLYGANLTGANLAGADMSGADLTAANLSLTNLTGANIAGVVTDGRTTCPDGTAGPCSF